MRLARPSPSASASLEFDVGVEHALDARLDLVGQLVAVGAEQLDAVVVIRVVRGRDHDADIGAQRARQHGDRRGRDRAKQEHVHARRAEARHHARSRSCSRTAAYPCRAPPGAGAPRSGRKGRQPCRRAWPPRPSWESGWHDRGSRRSRNTDWTFWLQSPPVRAPTGAIVWHILDWIERSQYMSISKDFFDISRLSIKVSA